MGSGAAQNMMFAGSSALIVVSVGLDTIKQIESRLMSKSYAGFLR